MILTSGARVLGPNSRNSSAVLAAWQQELAATWVWTGMLGGGGRGGLAAKGGLGKRAAMLCDLWRRRLT